MQVSHTSTHTAISPECQWLTVDHTSDTTVRIAGVGSLAAERAEELWSTVEYALEIANGRDVSVDLTAVTRFDLDAMEALATVVKTALRRHDNLRITLLAGSSLSEYAHSFNLAQTVIPEVAPSTRPTRERPDPVGSPARSTPHLTCVPTRLVCEPQAERSDPYRCADVRKLNHSAIQLLVHLAVIGPRLAPGGPW